MAEKWLNANTILSVVVVGALMFTLFDAPQHREDRLRQMEMRLAGLETVALHRIAQLEAEEIPPPEQKAFNREIRGNYRAILEDFVAQRDAVLQRLTSMENRFSVIEAQFSILMKRFHRIMSDHQHRNDAIEQELEP